MNDFSNHIESTKECQTRENMIYLQKEAAKLSLGNKTSFESPEIQQNVEKTPEIQQNIMEKTSEILQNITKTPKIQHNVDTTPEKLPLKTPEETPIKTPEKRKSPEVFEFNENEESVGKLVKTPRKTEPFKEIPRAYQCSECQESYSDQFALFEHIASVHDDEDSNEELGK